MKEKNIMMIIIIKQKKKKKDKHKKHRKNENSSESKYNNQEDIIQSNKDIQYISKLFIISELKRKNDKLKESGIRIKWHKDSTFSYNKDIIFEYFVEYGPIVEINLNSEKREAYILYQTNMSIVKLINKIR